jgi:hypothetical protein
VPDAEISSEQVDATIESRAFVVLLAIAAVVGVVVSLATWCFLELINQIQLSAVVIASVLSAKSGLGAEPLVIVGVVVSYIVTVRLSAPAPATASGDTPATAPSGPVAAGGQVTGSNTPSANPAR